MRSKFGGSEGRKRRGTDWECALFVNVREGLDHVWDGEGFGAVPVDHSV